MQLVAGEVPAAPRPARLELATFRSATSFDEIHQRPQLSIIVCSRGLRLLVKFHRCRPLDGVVRRLAAQWLHRKCHLAPTWPT